MTVSKGNWRIIKWAHFQTCKKFFLATGWSALLNRFTRARLESKDAANWVAIKLCFDNTFWITMPRPKKRPQFKNKSNTTIRELWESIPLSLLESKLWSCSLILTGFVSILMRLNNILCSGFPAPGYKRPEEGFHFHCSGCGIWYHPIASLICQRETSKEIKLR